MEPLLVSPFFKELHSQLKHLPIHLLQYIAYLVHKHFKLGMPLLGYYQLCKAQAGHNLPLPLHTALKGDIKWVNRKLWASLFNSNSFICQCVNLKLLQVV